MFLSRECDIDFSRHYHCEIQEHGRKKRNKIGHTQGTGNENVIGLFISNIETRRQQVNAFNREIYFLPRILYLSSLGIAP